MKTRSLFDRIEYLFVVFALLLLTESFTALISGGGNGSLTDSNPLSLASSLAVYCVALLYLLRHPRHAAHTIGRNVLLLAMFLLPLASIFWSDDPALTARRAIALALTGILCVYFVVTLSPNDFLRRLLLALFIGGVLSIVAAVVAPQIAIGQSSVNQGAWSGIYGHKSILGRIAAIAVVVAIYVRPQFGWERAIRWMTFAIFLFLSVMSESRVSWLMMLGALALVPILGAIRSRRLSGGVKAFIAGSLGLTFVIGAALGYSGLLASFGRDDTFSGRTLLWQGAIDVASDSHPVFGAGYRAFWTENGADGVRAYIPHWGSLPDHGHNGYLDIWLELGVVGAVLFGVFMIVTLFRLLRRIYVEPHETAWVAFFSIACIFLLNNSAASVAFRHSDIAWAIVVLASLYARGRVAAPAPDAMSLRGTGRRAMDFTYGAPRGVRA